MKNRLVGLLLVFSVGFAAESEQDELFVLLKQESRLATKTKKNIDYLPGLITVLRQSELKRFGFKNVREALELVPGIDFSTKGLIIRGIGNAFVSSKAKVMLNGVSFNNTASSSTPYLMRLPIDMVERIEVIRGPGSALYGEYAFSGVINIVTVKESNTVLAGYEDFGHGYDGRQGGVAAFYKNPDFSMQLIVTDTATDGRYTDIKSDILFQERLANNIPVSNAPGGAELLSNEKFFIFDLRYKKFSLSAASVDVAEGEGFGEGNALPVDDGEANIRIIQKSFDARQEIALEDDVTFGLKAGLLLSELQVMDFYIFPKGFQVQPEGMPFTLSYPDGIVVGSHGLEEKRYGNAELSVDAFTGHKLLLGLEVSESQMKEGYNKRNIGTTIPYAPLGSLQHFSGVYGPLGGERSRSVRSLYAQDEWCLGERTAVTMGVRYDDYDDIGANTSPRIAAVHELDPANILKLQYAHAFRPPNYIELYMQNNPFAKGDPTLGAETVDTYEAVYIYNSQEEIIRIGIFYSLLNNLIGLEAENEILNHYADKGEATLQGIEAEFEKRYFDETTIRAHISYVKARNDDRTIDRYAALTGTLGASKRLYKNFGTALLYRFTGERERQSGDTRKALEAEHRVDLTFFNDHTGVKNFHLKAGIKNLLDADTAYPAPANTYLDDYPRAGRSYWVRAEFGFKGLL